MKITESYRPNSFSQVIAQGTAVRQIQSSVQRSGYSGSSFWLTGETGTGKTTLAQIMANEFCTEPEFTVTEIVGRDVTVEFVRDYDRRMSYKPMGSGRCLIINESQDLSDSVVSLLLSLVEKINRSAHDMIIFTAMIDVLEFKHDPMNRWRALQGRCSVIELADSSSPIFRQDVVEYLKGVAAQEHIRGADITGLCEKAGWSIRQALNLLDMCDREQVPAEPVIELPACTTDSARILPAFAHRLVTEPGLHIFPGCYAIPVEDIEHTERLIQAEKESLDSQENLPAQTTSRSSLAALKTRSSRSERIYVHQFVFIKESWEHWTQRETENLKTVLIGLTNGTCGAGQEYPNERTFSQGRMVFEFAQDGRTGEILTKGRIQRFRIEKSCPADSIRRRQEYNDALDVILCRDAQQEQDAPTDSPNQMPEAHVFQLGNYVLTKNTAWTESEQDALKTACTRIAWKQYYSYDGERFTVIIGTMTIIVNENNSGGAIIDNGIKQDFSACKNTQDAATEKPLPGTDPIKKARLVKRNTTDSQESMPTETHIRQAHERITQRFAQWAQNITKAIACW